MNDYINRADALEACHPVMPTDGVGTIGITYEEIKNIPAADVVEVVRCKDCVHADFLFDFIPTCICTRIGERCERREKDFFCAYGKRRPDNE